MWRRYYNRQAINELCQVQAGAGVAVLVSSDELEDPVEEPSELDDFLSIFNKYFRQHRPSFWRIHMDSSNFPARLC